MCWLETVVFSLKYALRVLTGSFYTSSVYLIHTKYEFFIQDVLLKKSLSIFQVDDFILVALRVEEGPK